ncbi:hypothetical protein NXV90_09985 [Bacteroides ovatus]|nr:hypothetical protein [Bacteroides ovatus]
MPRSAVWKSVVSSKGSYGAHAAARSVARGGLPQNLPLSLRASVFSDKILQQLSPTPFDATETDSIHTGSATA